VIDPVSSPYLIPFKGRLDIAKLRTAPPRGAPDKDEARERLTKAVDRIAELQPILYAHDRHSILLIFQALDAAGKDGTIRAILEGVNPAGCHVHSFKTPSTEELDHDFLWRSAVRLPARGMIGVFNRSYYEEVLVVRVHPELLAAENLLEGPTGKELWEERYESIRDHERHLARNGTVILKFFLHVSKAEQRRRFLSRLEEPEKNWKFSERDVEEQGFRKQYMRAFEDALRETSRPWAPWYAIPADDKHYLRMCVAETIVGAMEQLDLHYPKVAGKDRARFKQLAAILKAQKRY
jgi:PPK2 family polyphosphate:nucleotide phosphotransferase